MSLKFPIHAVIAVLLFSLVSTGVVAQQGPLPVTVAAPLVKKIIEWDEYTGRFEANERVEIRARVSGFLESIHFKAGQLVEKGQLLFVIDPRPFEAQVAVAQAALDGAKTRVRLAEREFTRAQELVKRSTISREVFDQRGAELETSRTTVLAAQAQLRLAELDLNFTRVTAPLAGRVSDARIDVGNLVQGGTGQSTLLSTVVSLDPILFTFSASESEYLKYSRLNATGQRESAREAPVPVFVRLMDESDFTWEGQMSFVDNELSQQTATIRAQAIFDNPSGFLTPGVFGRLKLKGSEEYDAILIPDSAVVSDQHRKMVLIVGKDGVVEGRPVELGPMHDGLRVVQGGLASDEVIVVTGVQRARPGGKVIPKLAILNADGSLTEKPGS